MHFCIIDDYYCRIKEYTNVTSVDYWLDLIKIVFMTKMNYRGTVGIT